VAEFRHSRNVVTFQVDDEKIKFLYDRVMSNPKVAGIVTNSANIVAAVKAAIKSEPSVSAFLDYCYHEDAAVRYLKMLQMTLEDRIPLLSDDEIALYTTFTSKGGLTEEEFIDNFAIIESTLVMDDPAEAQRLLLAEILSDRPE
jgi:hypothetical protein